MTIQTTRWRPDTCGCTIDYEWDDSVSQELRVHTVKEISKCIYHQALGLPEAYTAVQEENASKNKALAYIGDTYSEFSKRLFEIKWRMNPDRTITITLPDALKSDKDLINNDNKGKFPKEVDFV